MLAIEDFFDRMGPDEARQLLWTWLKTTVAGNYNTTLDARERALILDFYESMERLLEASFLLQQSALKKSTHHHD